MAVSLESLPAQQEWEECLIPGSVVHQGELPESSGVVVRENLGEIVTDRFEDYSTY